MVTYETFAEYMDTQCWTNLGVISNHLFDIFLDIRLTNLFKHNLLYWLTQSVPYQYLFLSAKIIRNKDKNGNTLGCYIQSMWCTHSFQNHRLRQISEKIYEMRWKVLRISDNWELMMTTISITVFSSRTQRMSYYLRLYYFFSQPRNLRSR